MFVSLYNIMCFIVNRPTAFTRSDRVVFTSAGRIVVSSFWHQIFDLCAILSVLEYQHVTQAKCK